LSRRGHDNQARNALMAEDRKKPSKDEKEFEAERKDCRIVAMAAQNVRGTATIGGLAEFWTGADLKAVIS
jgi:hypothetical protein